MCAGRRTHQASSVNPGRDKVLRLGAASRLVWSCRCRPVTPISPYTPFLLPPLHLSETVSLHDTIHLSSHAGLTGASLGSTAPSSLATQLLASPASAALPPGASAHEAALSACAMRTAALCSAVPVRCSGSRAAGGILLLGSEHLWHCNRAMCGASAGRAECSSPVRVLPSTGRICRRGAHAIVGRCQ